MNLHAWTEDKLVEQPAIGLFAALGWQTMSAMSLQSANREIYGLLKDGIPVSIPDREALTPGRFPARRRLPAVGGGRRDGTAVL